MENFKKRQAEELENEKRRQLARMQDNISEFEDETYGSTVYDYGLRGNSLKQSSIKVKNINKSPSPRSIETEIYIQKGRGIGSMSPPSRSS